MNKNVLFYLVIFLILLNNTVCSAQTQYLQGPVLGKISSLYGFRQHPILKKYKFHAGLDIAAAYDSPIYALQDGYVVTSINDRNCGNMVIIQHAYPYYYNIPTLKTKYCHNSKNLVKHGQYVRRGDIIARVGSTGRATGPHLHFEVIYNGYPVEPLDYLKKLPYYNSRINYFRTHQNTMKYNNNYQYTFKYKKNYNKLY